MFSESNIPSPDIHQEMKELSDRLNTQYTPPIENHLTAPHVAAAVEELNRHPLMEGESDIMLPQSPEAKAEISIDSVIEQTKQAAVEKAQEAIERSEFKGPEVAAAIEGYYQDHIVSLKLIEQIIEGSSEDIQRIAQLADEGELGIQSDILKPAIQTLARLRASQQSEVGFNNLVGRTLSTLFTVPCIGQLTLDETAMEAISNEIGQLQQKIGKNTDKADIMNGMNQAKLTTQHEVRMGGQLLFHNTYFGNDILDGSGSLRSQAKQQQSVQSGQQKSVRVTTMKYGDAGSHGDNIHWSEVYDPSSYKRSNGGGTDRAVDARAGMMTFAVPLAEVINKAPFGRGIRYAVVDGKPDVVTEQPGGKLTGNIGSGSEEGVGDRFGVIDRVFWASDASYDVAIDYEIPVGGASVAKNESETQASENGAYIIQSDTDRLETFRQWRKGVEQDTAEFDELQQFAKDHTEAELLAKYGGLHTSSEAPSVVSISDLDMNEERTAAEAVKAGESILRTDLEGTWQRQASQAEPVISQLEQESLARFSGQYVVPLRASRPDFMNRGDNRVANAYGASLLLDIKRAA